MVEGYSKRSLEARDKRALEELISGSQMVKISKGADFLFTLGMGGVLGILISMALAALLATQDRSLAIPTLFTAAPLLGVFGVYIAHRLWRSRNEEASSEKIEMIKTLALGECLARTYTLSEALVEPLPMSAESNVLAKADEGTLLWFPYIDFEQQGKGLQRAAEKLEVLRSIDGSVAFAAWPSGNSLRNKFTVDHLAGYVKKAGGSVLAETSDLNFESLKANHS